MRFVFVTAWKELKRRFNDPGGLMSAILVPFAVGFLMASVMGGGGGPSIKAELMVTDLDNSFISQGILSALGSDQVADMIALEKVGLADGDRRINKGDASGHLVIPEGFGVAWLDRDAVELQLTVNPAQSISPLLIRQTLDAFLDLGDYLHKVFGTEINVISQTLLGDQPDLSIPDLSSDIAGKIAGFSGLVFPPLLTIEDVTPQAEGLKISMPLLMFPGILLMAAFFSANSQSTNFWNEKEKGTLARWVASPNAFYAFWLAQWLTAMALTVIVAAPIMLAGFFYLGISFEKYFTALAWLALTGPILFAFLTLIQVLSPSKKVGGMISMLVMFPLLMAGGSFFPVETMPEFIGALARYTPNGQVLEPLKGYFIGDHGAAGMFDHLWGILIVAVLLLLLAGRLSAGKSRAI